MDRRSFLKNTALGGSAAAATTLAAPAYAAGHRTLTMVTSWGRGLAGVFDAAQKAADNITAITDGSLTIEVKAAGELVGAFEVFDAVTSGQADMYHAADYYFINQHPGYAFFTGVPFGMTATELNNWYYHGNGRAMHDELGEIFGLKSFLAGNTGTQAGGWFRKEITKFYYTSGMHEPAAGLSLATNLDVFNDLSPAHQAAIEVGAGHANVWNLSQYLNNNGAALQRLQAGGVQVLEFPDEVWGAMFEASKAVYAEFMGDELFAKINDDYFASMDASSGWLTQSTGTFRAQRDRLRA